MSWWGVLTGRKSGPRNQLDALFLVPSAAITLQTSLGITAAGVGGVCYRGAGGAAFDQMQRDVLALVDDTPEIPDDVVVSTDEFGFTWLVVRRDDISRICTDVHAVNRALEEYGFASGLLCSAVTFGPAAATGSPVATGSTSTGSTSTGSTSTGGQSTGRVALVYLYKQGTFYPFAPLPARKRDNMTELSVRDALSAELPMEQDVSRWMAIWDAPVL